MDGEALRGQFALCATSTTRGERHPIHFSRLTVSPPSVRDMCGGLIELTELPPRADQRAVLMAAREARVAAGWRAGDIGSSAVFFAERAGERVAVAIERDPTRQIRR
jgi:hypothetical protein